MSGREILRSVEARRRHVQGVWVFVVTNHEAYDTGPSWSPDGSEIIFSSTRNRTEEDPSRTDVFAMPAPTILPPPGESASTTTIEQSESHQALAESTPIRRLTRGGLSTEPDWGRSSGRRACTIECTDKGEVLIATRSDDVICGFGGGDVVRGRGGGDTLLGGGGGDSMAGGSGGDTVRGNDLADGGLGRDVCVADRCDTTISCT